jgi:hypothetical protein
MCSGPSKASHKLLPQIVRHFCRPLMPTLDGSAGADGNFAFCCVSVDESVPGVFCVLRLRVSFDQGFWVMVFHGLGAASVLRFPRVMVMRRPMGQTTEVSFNVAGGRPSGVVQASRSDDSASFVCQRCRVQPSVSWFSWTLSAVSCIIERI